MAYETIQYEVSDKVAEITLDRPDERNALTGTMMTELLEALTEADADESVGAVLLTGAGESFCSGGDLEEFQEHLDARPAELVEEASRDLLKGLATYEKPLVGGINGDAVAGGCGLTASCHLAYAPPSAKLGTVELRIGMFPFAILPIIRRRIGDGRALELTLTGDLISAERASEIGLLTDVVENPVERARETAEQIASYSPLAVQLGLHGYQQTRNMPVDDAIDAMSAYRVPVYKSHDLNEGAKAFFEDREPNWKGY